MKRNTTIALVLVGVLVVSGVVVGAAGFDALFTDTDEVEDDEIQLTAANSEYAELSDDDQLKINMTDLQANATLTAEVFNATYKAEDTSNGSLYINESSVPAGVDNITDSAGNSIVGDQNPYNFSDDGETDATFSLTVDTEETTDLEDTIGIVASAEEEDESTPGTVNFNGTATDEGDTIAPKNTTLVAVNQDRDDSDTATVIDDGQYGQSADFGDDSESDDITIDAEAGDEIAFYVREEDGPERVEGTYEVTEDDVDDDVTQLDLEFPDGTFDLQVDNAQADKESVQTGDEINVTADLTNNGSLTLDQTINLSNLDEDVVREDQDVEIEPGTVDEEIEFNYEVQETSNFTLTVESEDDSADTDEIEIEDDLVFSGVVKDEDELDAPDGTEIVAVVDDGSPTDPVTTTDGEYDNLAVSADEGQTVTFFVGDDDGPEAIETVDVEQDDLDTVNVEQNLTFPAGTFSLTIEEFTVDPDEITPGDETTVTADLSNNGTATLSEDVDFIVSDDDDAADTNESFAVDGGETEQVSFTYERFDSDDFDVTIDTLEDSATAGVTVDGIAAIGETTFEHDFVGIVTDDEEELDVTMSAVENETDDAYTGELPLRLVTSSGDTVDLGTVTVDEGEVDDATIDPNADIPATEDLGDATLNLAGVETTESVTLIHEAQEFDSGATATSAPQAAQLYADGSFSVTQWDDSEQTYSSDEIDHSGEFTEAVNVHRSLYVITDQSDFRFGWDYEQSPADGFEDGDVIELSDEWNLISSNYNISDSEITVEDDLNLDVDLSEVTVIDPSTGDEIDSQNVDELGDRAYDAYWVFTGTDSDVTRTLNVSDYSASDRASIAE